MIFLFIGLKLISFVFLQGSGRQRTQEAPARLFFKTRFLADIVSKRRISLFIISYDSLKRIQRALLVRERWVTRADQLSLLV